MVAWNQVCEIKANAVESQIKYAWNRGGITMESHKIVVESNQITEGKMK